MTATARQTKYLTELAAAGGARKTIVMDAPTLAALARVQAALGGVTEKEAVRWALINAIRNPSKD